MGLEGLASAQSRIAQIQSMIDARIPHRSATRSANGPANGSASSATTQQLLESNAATAGTSRIDASFNELLNQVSQANGASTTTSTAPVNGLGRGAQHEQFARDVLSGIGAPTTAENIRAMKAWALAEGTKAQFNPLATTRKGSNTTDFNSVGVKNYPSYQDGVAATIGTLKNGRYPNILAALAQGNSAEGVGLAVAQSPWGTGQGVLRVLRQGNI
jgi:hypothetical protein